MSGQALDRVAECGPNVFVVSGVDLHRARTIGITTAITACGLPLRGIFELHEHKEGLVRVLRLLSARASTVPCTTCCPGERA